ncbi:MAG: hypothetical protein ACOH2K_14015 [Burkholderiaceae bacterium]
MDAPSYSQVSPASLLYASSAPPAGSGWCGYWASKTNTLGTTATLAQTWADVGGIYLILESLPVDFSALESQLAILLPRLSPTGLARIVWIANGDETPSYWRTQLFNATADVGGSLKWSIATPMSFTLGDYTLSLAAGYTFSLQTDDTGYGFLLPAACCTFYSQGVPLNATGVVRIALAGTGTGAIVSRLALKKQDPDPMTQLGVMLRYACVDAAAAADPTVDDDNLALYLSMPVLRIASGTALTDLYLDPSSPCDVTRSYLDLVPPNITATQFLSPFVTTVGYSIFLTPLAGVHGLQSGRLGFCKSPLFASEVDNAGYEVYHLAPDGTFVIEVDVPIQVQKRRRALQDSGAGAEQDAWMFGLSGAEYANLPASGNAIAFFVAGNNAWISSSPNPDGSVALKAAATTAYMTLMPPVAATAVLGYYAQPIQSPLFVAATDLGSGFYDFHPMPSGSLPPWSADPAVFPVGAYRWIATDAATVAMANKAEAAIFAPERRQIIGGRSLLAQDTPQDNPPLAVTPQGLFAQLSADMNEWTGILFANMPSSVNKQLAFTPVKEKFQEALQSNQLFFVVSNVTEFDAQSGVPGGGDLNCDIEGWTFRLAPKDWRTKLQGNQTLMLFKYCNRSLTELVKDTSAWGWKDAAKDPTLEATQILLQGILDDVFTRSHPQDNSLVASGDPYLIFYEEVANNPMWNGVLFFNVPVDFSEMPPSLRFLAAGIDTTQFYAHHIGFSVTPFTSDGSTVTPQQTGAFGLIDYEDPVDLAPSTTVPFGFKTLQLKVRFANAQIADFAAQAELMVNRLFGAPLLKQDPSRGNNLIMQGSCQKVAGVPSYSFVLTGQNIFSTQGSSLTSVEILTVRVDTTGGDGSDTTPLTTVFTLEGNQRFIYFADFDLYSYGYDDVTATDGYLRFTGLAVSMAFTIAAPSSQSFSLNEAIVNFDASQSVPRANSLAARFPLRVNGILISPGADTASGTAAGQTPEQLGFVSISCPLDQTPMNAPWYGLTFSVDLGTIGALAGSGGLTLTVLAAWSQGVANVTPAYLGIKFPSFVPGAGSLPIQGVLKLGFKGFNFEVYDAGGGKLGYQLWMNRFALSILCWSFPPGNANLVLFGNPDNPQGSLGWYAAYAAKPATKAVSGRKRKTALPLDPAADDAPASTDATTTASERNTARRLAGGRRNPVIG